MKKILLLSLLCISLSSTAFAASSLDCGFVQNWVQRSLTEFDKSLNWQRPKLMPRKAFWQALQNLSNFCFGKAWWAESDYLFDHIIDVGFRSLDGYENSTLRYDIEADTTWLERQRLLKEYANPINNTVPETIIQSFNTFRPSAEKPWNTLDLDTNCNIDNTNNISLYGKYKAVCEIASCIVNKRIIITQNTSDKSSIARIKSNENICEQIAQKRYWNEISYIKQLVARSWIRIITNLVEQYTKNYFVNNRWQNLYEKFTRFDQDLIFVNRKVQEWTPVCSAK
jgi:hypothetical protein